MMLKNIKDVFMKTIISPELDVEGFFISKKEIQEEHVLFKQFKKSFDNKIGNFVKFDDSKENILREVKKYYETHPEINNNLKEVVERFEKIKIEFLEECSDVFDDSNLCHQECITIYPSIWGIGMLNMKEEAVSFDVYARSIDEMLYVVLHELLHVFFYSYINNVYKIDFNTLDKKELWNMVEIFNSIILDLPQFRKFYPKYDFNNYPEHIEKINIISNTLRYFTIKDFLVSYKKSICTFSN